MFIKLSWICSKESCLLQNNASFVIITAGSDWRNEIFLFYKFIFVVKKNLICFEEISALKKSYSYSYSSSLYCWCTYIKYSRKGAELQETHPNVNSEACRVHLASQARHQGTLLPPCWHWGWNCTWCTLQTSSPLPRKLGSRELVCKVHLVQFQLKYTRVHGWVHLSSQARIGVLKHELRCTWIWVGEALHLFRRTSF